MFSLFLKRLYIQATFENYIVARKGKNECVSYINITFWCVRFAILFCSGARKKVRRAFSGRNGGRKQNLASSRYGVWAEFCLHLYFLKFKTL